MCPVGLYIYIYIYIIYFVFPIPLIYKSPTYVIGIKSLLSEASYFDGKVGFIGFIGSVFLPLVRSCLKYFRHSDRPAKIYILLIHFVQNL